MAVIGYVRASSAKQVASPENQKAIITEHCKRSGLPFDGIFYVDPATSGKVNVGERPAGREMMARLKSGDTLVVAHLDRLCRSIVNFARVLEQFEQRGISLHIIDIPGGTLEPNNHIGRLLMTILVAFAEYERRLNGARVAEGFAELRKEGHSFGSAPRYGKRRTKVWSKRLNKYINNDVWNPEEMKVVLKCVELRSKGMSAEDIALYLNHKARIRTRSKNEWSHSQVAQLLLTGYQYMAEKEECSHVAAPLIAVVAESDPEGVLNKDDCYIPSDELDDDFEGFEEE